MSRDTAPCRSTEELNSRLLLQWAHNIAKGMKYLSRKHIMHGDLAARNILIGRGQGCNGLSKLVAKVSDFGLSKTFYDNIRYKKQKRQYVPWKWMAIEYLQTGCLTITSDVWSYGIVFWEIFSLGKEPYAGQNSEEMISKLKDGYRLPCPEEVTKESNWSPTEIYNQLADACFVSEPMKRATFSDIVQTLEAALDDKEKDEYKELTEQYASMRELMEDPVTKLKRSSTFTRNSLKQLNEITQNLSSKTASPHKQGQLKPQEEENPSYIKAVAVNNPLLLCQDSADSLSTARLEGNQVIVKDIVADNTIEYITFPNSEDLNSGQNIHIDDKKDQGVTYIAFEEISTTSKDTEEGVKLLPNIINAKDSELKDNETIQNTEEDLSAAYVTISTANS
jgi:serine/threonine protein kinase